jgi:mannose-1-phosphate guanylyltransferase / phosphomannomutase
MLRQVLRSGKYTAGFHVRKSPFDKSSMDIIFFDVDGQDLASKRTKAIERQFFSEDFRRASFDSIGSLYFPSARRRVTASASFRLDQHELIAGKSSAP